MEYDADGMDRCEVACPQCGRYETLVHEDEESPLVCEHCATPGVRTLVREPAVRVTSEYS